MGCGCRKPRKPSKLTADRKATLEKKAAILKAESKTKRAAAKMRLRMAKTRSDICSSCEYSEQDVRDKKYNINICHKANRPLPIIFKDKNFKCPIGKF